MRTGRCLCGEVTFAAASTGRTGVCHCRQCQRWIGGPFIGTNVPEDAMRAEGPVAVRRTSAWASRARCGECGSPLWYRYDKGIDGAGEYEVPVGLFDEPDGLVLKSEIFVDRKPDGFDFAGDHPRLTEAETLALYAPSSEGG